MTPEAAANLARLQVNMDMQWAHDWAAQRAINRQAEEAQSLLDQQAEQYYDLLDKHNKTLNKLRITESEFAGELKRISDVYNSLARKYNDLLSKANISDSEQSQHSPVSEEEFVFSVEIEDEIEEPIAREPIIVSEAIREANIQTIKSIIMIGVLSCLILIPLFSFHSPQEAQEFLLNMGEKAVREIIHGLESARNYFFS